MTKGILTYEELVEAREKEYGDFHGIAVFVSDAERTLANINRAQSVALAPAQKEAMHNILVKLARIAHNPAHYDSWEDIGGYSVLGKKYAPAPSITIEGPSKD